MKQLIAIVTVITLILSCAAVCAATALAGDADGDGAVNMKDVLCLRKHLAGIPVALSAQGADGNGDGKVNMKDVLWLRGRLAQADNTVSSLPVVTLPSSPALPTVDEELRGVWLAYYEVAELLKPTPDATKAAIDNALNICKRYGANAVFFHVRAHSDAYYNSELFPQVAAVKTLLKSDFDPLTYATEAAHARGITLHAWLNPYRVGKAENAVCADTFTLGGNVYYNPASETVKRALLAGIAEILENYDVDGIHFDDYFYPSATPTSPQHFDTGYHTESGSLAAWRREQVTDFVKRACALTHEKKPNAVFGISPAGNIETDRDELYADVETWLKTPGCVDYLCPQLYYGFENGAAPFTEALARWNGLSRANGVKLYAGLAVYKAGLREDTWAGAGKTEWATHNDVLARQIETIRAQNGVSGFVLFSYRYLTDAGFDDTCDKIVAKKELENLKNALAA